MSLYTCMSVNITVIVLIEVNYGTASVSEIGKLANDNNMLSLLA